MLIKLCGNEHKFWCENVTERSYRDTVSDSERHHGRLSETQEVFYAVFILHVKKHFGQLDTDLKNAERTKNMNWKMIYSNPYTTNSNSNVRNNTVWMKKERKKE